MSNYNFGMAFYAQLPTTMIVFVMFDIVITIFLHALQQPVYDAMIVSASMWTLISFSFFC